MKSLIISSVLFIIGVFLIQQPEYQTFGSLLVIAIFLWIIYKLIFKLINRLTNIFFNKNKNTNSEKNVKIHNGKINKGAYTMDEIIPEHNLLVVSVKKSITDGNAVYDAARFAWKLNVDRARKMEFILAHNRGHIIGVFKADEWLPATDDEFADLNQDADPDRWGFVGVVAPSEILLKYFNKKLPEDFIKRGAANPIRFIEVSQGIEPAIEVINSPITGQSNNVPKAKKVIKTDEIISDITGTIDADGDFNAWAQISTDQFGENGKQLFVKAITIATLNGISTSPNEQEIDYLVGQTIGVNTPYEKITGLSGDKFSIDVRLDVFEVKSSESIFFTADSFNTSINIDDCKLTITSLELDDDGDLNVGYKVKTESAVIFGVSISKESSDYRSPNFEEAQSGETENSSYVMGYVEGEKIIATLTIMQPLYEKLELSGVGQIEVEELNEPDTDNSFFDEDEDESLNVFVACVALSSLIEEVDDNFNVIGESIRTKLYQIMDSITEYVDIDARFFLKTASNEVSEVSTISEFEEIVSIKSAGEVEALGEFIHLIFVVKGNDHWDYKFLSASAEIPGTVYIWGFCPRVGELAEQSYCEGDLDTGIMNYPDDDSHYSGANAMKFFGLQTSDFDLKNYGLD